MSTPDIPAEVMEGVDLQGLDFAVQVDFSADEIEMAPGVGVDVIADVPDIVSQTMETEVVATPVSVEVQDGDIAVRAAATQRNSNAGRRRPRAKRGSEDEDLVRLYLIDIGKYPLLTKDDEVRLAQEIEAGIAAAKRLEEEGEIFVDQAGFERERFQVADGINFVFRGREELPEFQQPESVVTAVLSQDERPLHTSGDEYGDWLDEQTAGESHTDPFLRAGETGAEVEFIVNSTPLGIVDAALTLTELGIGESKATDRLQHLREKIKNRQYDPEVFALFDDLYIAGAVDTQTGGIYGLNAPGHNTTRIATDAPMLVALSLAGNSDASEVIDVKRRIVDYYDSTKVTMEIGGKVIEEPELYKQPGEKLTADEIEALRQAHLIAVHTTPIKPFVLDAKNGIAVVRPTAEFVTGQHNQFPRSSLHFSLNHAVLSHIGGNFNSRPYTIVSPLADMAELNGAPAVLNGVDTYFNIDPGQGVLIPGTATIIEMLPQVNSPFIQQQGNILQINTSKIDTKDLQELAQFVERLFPEEEYIKLVGGASFVTRGLLNTGAFGGSFNGYGGTFGVYNSLEREHERAQETYGYNQTPEAQDYLKPFVTLYDLVTSRLPDNADDRQKEHAVHDTLESMFTGEIDIEDYQAVTPLFIEGLRKLLVNQLIQQQEGKVVSSDGMSAYIQDEEFSQALRTLREHTNIRGGLHVDQPESYLENAYSRAMGEAITMVDVPEDIREERPELGWSMKGDFRWEDYDSKSIWSALYRSPWQTRRLAISMGLLNYTNRRHFPKEDDEVALW